LNSFILWPGQSCFVFNQNNVWNVNPSFQRWKVPNNTTIFIDCNNGSDSNDGLAAGVGNAFQTFNGALRVALKDLWDLRGTSSYPIGTIFVQLAANAVAGVPTSNAYSLGHLAFAPVGGEGRGMIIINGVAGASNTVVISDTSGGNIAAFGGAMNVTLANLQIGQTGAGSPVANSCISASDNASVWIQTGVILGHCTAQQLYAEYNSKIVALAGFSTVGSASNLGQTDTGGLIDLRGQAITFSNAPNYSQQTLTAQNGGKILLAGTTYTNSSTVTGTRYFASGLSLIDTNTGTPNTSIPGNANGSLATGAVVN